MGRNVALRRSESLQHGPAFTRCVLLKPVPRKRRTKERIQRGPSVQPVEEGKIAMIGIDRVQRVPRQKVRGGKRKRRNESAYASETLSMKRASLKPPSQAAET